MVSDERLARLAYEAHGADEPEPGVFPWSGLPDYVKQAWLRAISAIAPAIRAEALEEAAKGIEALLQPDDCREYQQGLCDAVATARAMAEKGATDV